MCTVGSCDERRDGKGCLCARLVVIVLRDFICQPESKSLLCVEPSLSCHELPHGSDRLSCLLGVELGNVGRLKVEPVSYSAQISCAANGD